MPDGFGGPVRRRRPLRFVLALIVALIVLATAAATALLWPEPDRVQATVQNSGAATEIRTVEVVAVNVAPCSEIASNGGAAGANAPESEVMSSTGSAAATQSCTEVRARLPVGEVISFTLDESQTQLHTLHEGDAVRVVEYTLGDGVGAETQYAFADYPRGGKMLVIAILFMLIVIAVGRLRGALALVGVGAAVVLLTTFVLPAILSGRSPILVAIVGSIGIMVIVLYLAHGLSHRTTAALFGSIFGILFTALGGFAVTRWLRFTGVVSVEDSSLLVAAPGVDMNDVLTATIVIAGLGVLNDITVAQASAVWEMRHLNPELGIRTIYRSAMRIGRDHIASSIYTLVFAYTGAMLVVLLLLYTYPQDLLQLVTSEQMGQEVIRTLVGAAGLVLSMPVTTAFAALFAAPAVSGDVKLPRTGHTHFRGAE